MKRERPKRRKSIDAKQFLSELIGETETILKPAIHYAVQDPDGDWQRLCWLKPLANKVVPTDTLTILSNWLALPLARRCPDCYEHWLRYVRENQKSRD